MMPTPITCEEHSAARNVIWSAPNALSSGSKTGPMNSPCATSTVLASPAVAIALAANGPPPVASLVVISMCSFPRPAWLTPPRMTRSMKSGVRNGRRSLRATGSRIPRNGISGGATLSGWAQRRQSSSIGPGASRRAESVRQLAKRGVAVRLRLFRQAQHAFADDVALNLIGAAADRGEIGVQRPERHRITDGIVRSGQHRFSADDFGFDAGRLVQDPGHRDLAERHQRGRLDPIDRGLRPLSVPAVHRSQRVDAGDMLTNIGIIQPAGLPGQFDEQIGLLGLRSLGVLGGACYVRHEPSLVAERSL